MDIRVASIIDFGEIVINKGEIDGIYSQMEFLVYEDGQSIIDPITKENLGKLEIPKGKFKVLHTQEKMTVLISDYRPNKNVFNLGIIEQEDNKYVKIKSIKIGDKVKVLNESKFVAG